MRKVYTLELEEIAANGHSLILFREPDSDKLNFIWNEDKPNLTFRHIEELNGQAGYVIAPFRVDENHPIVLVPTSKIMVLDVESMGVSQLRRSEDPIVESVAVDEGYVRNFETFINVLQNKIFDKLVLSRPREVGKPESFGASLSFFEACRRYPHSYVYLLYTPQTGGWLGCTPETILSGKNGLWRTVALAGTLPLLKNKKLPVRWNEKQRKEQEYVAAYIRRQLDSRNIKYLENGPYPAYAGALAHLKTDFYFLLSDEDKLGDLLNMLHPTPAVCGLPKEEAYRFILENEGYDRSYYSGFVGYLDPKEETSLYVNLRCVHIQDEKLTLYAGGGLLASSELNDEYQETEKKMQTIVSVVNGE